MFKTLLVLTLLFLLTLTACKNKLTQFYVDYDSKATIPSSVPVSSPFSIWTPEQETNSSFEFESNDTRSDKIQEILLKDLVITIIAPDNRDFSFLKEVDIYIDAENLPQQKLAFKHDIPTSIGREIICETIDFDFQEYIKEETFVVRLRTVKRELITEDVEINIYTNFLVDAKLIN